MSKLLNLILVIPLLLTSCDDGHVSDTEEYQIGYEEGHDAGYEEGVCAMCRRWEIELSYDIYTRHAPSNC